jgi:hypothetical protein
MSAGGGTRAHVKSVRLDDATFKRIRAYALAKGMTESAALRELAVRGLSLDGLELYSSEMGTYLRSVMSGCLDSFRDELQRRNDEQEDRIARVVSRSTKGSLVAALEATDMVKAMFKGLTDVPDDQVWATYWRQAGEIQAGRTFDEAKRHAEA